MTAPDWIEIATVEQLTALLGESTPAAADKERSALTEVDRDWLAASPFCIMATADAEGRCEASPKGDPAGQLVHVVDDTTERPEVTVAELDDYYGPSYEERLYVQP